MNATEMAEQVMGLAMEISALRAEVAILKDQNKFFREIVKEAKYPPLVAPQALECGDEGRPQSPLSLYAFDSRVHTRFTKAECAAYNALTANDWLENDWADLHEAMHWVILNVCRRHKIIPDIPIATVPRGTNKPS